MFLHPTSTVGLAQSGTCFGKTPCGHQIPKNYWLRDSRELEGVEEPHPKVLQLAVGDHPSTAW